jgi:hypothetical protein
MPKGVAAVVIWCAIGFAHLSFLGKAINKLGISPDEEKIFTSDVSRSVQLLVSTPPAWW